MSRTVMKRRMPTTLVNRRGDDDADADGHAANQNGERSVVLLHDFFPEMIRRKFVHHQKRHGEDDDPKKCKHDGIHDTVYQRGAHFICLPCNGDRSCRRIDTNRDCRARTWGHFSLHLLWPDSSLDIALHLTRAGQQPRKRYRGCGSLVASGADWRMIAFGPAKVLEAQGSPGQEDGG